MPVSYTHLKHTFREFYSTCYDGFQNEIDYEMYQAIWGKTLAEVNALADGETISVAYMGATVEMTADEIKAIYDAQQVVYTPVSYTHLDVYKRQLICYSVKKRSWKSGI